MKNLNVFRNEQGNYALTDRDDDGVLPVKTGPWTFLKEIRFDGSTPLIGASKKSAEIQAIIEKEGYYLDGPSLELE